MQRIERQSALNKINAQIQSKIDIIITAKSCHYSKWNIERKERELEELYAQRDNIARA